MHSFKALQLAFRWFLHDFWVWFKKNNHLLRFEWYQISLKYKIIVFHFAVRDWLFLDAKIFKKLKRLVRKEMVFVLT